MSILPPGDRREPSHRAKWLWRTLRAAELAGLDAGQVLGEAIDDRELAGARASTPRARWQDHRLGVDFLEPPPPDH
jgi:hypothetical protein